LRRLAPLALFSWALACWCATMVRNVVDTSYYELFDLSPDATAAQIKKAYYARARSCHPDKHPGDAAKEQEFKALSEAYQTLFDEERRAVYDAMGREGLQGESVYSDPKQVFAAVFGGPEFEPWIGEIAAAAVVDEELQAPLKAAQVRAAENHAKLLGLIRSGAPPDEVAACRDVQRALMAVEDQARQELADGAARVQRANVSSCAEHLEALIAPYVAAALHSDAADEQTRQLARIVFEEQLVKERDRLKRCSMGEQLLQTLGYAYVRQTQKVRGKRGEGAQRLGGVYEQVVHSVHNLSEATSAIGTAVGMASDAWRLARDARPETLPEKRLSDVQRAELEERVRRRTMDMAWAMTRHHVERTARAVVDHVLGRAYANAGDRKSDGKSSMESGVESGVDGGVGGGAAVDVTDGAALPTPISPAELNARAEALLLIGAIFSNERPHETVERAVDGLHKLATRANDVTNEAKERAQRLWGNLLTAAAPSERRTDAPPESVGAFFRELGKWK